MKFGNFVHLAVDCQRRFLFPADTGMPQRDIGGNALLRGILEFDAALAALDVPAIWVASSERFGPKTGLTLVEPPDAEARRMLVATHDFPAMLAGELRGAVALKIANSAFSNPVLARRLRRIQVSTLLITGLYAGQCIRETVLDAVDAGFYCRVVADLTLDNIPGDTAILRRKRLIDLFAHLPQVEITDSTTLLRELRGGGSEKKAPPILRVAAKTGSRVLLHHFRQESRRSAVQRTGAVWAAALPAHTDEQQFAGVACAVNDEGM